jgi:hypothetical protein
MKMRKRTVKHVKRRSRFGVLKIDDMGYTNKEERAIATVQKYRDKYPGGKINEINERNERNLFTNPNLSLEKRYELAEQLQDNGLGKIIGKKGQPIYIGQKLGYGPDKLYYKSNNIIYPGNIYVGLEYY